MKPRSILMDHAVRLGPAVLAALVAVFQMVRVETDGLIRWKGGGFGMYSEFHANQRQIVIEPEALEKEAESNGADLYEAKRACRIYPRPEAFERLARQIRDHTGREPVVELWETDFNPTSSSLSRRLIGRHAP